MTNVTRWDPFSDMLTLREAMTQLFDGSYVAPTTLRNTQGFVPALDLSETETAYLVELSIPGVKPEDIDVSVENNVLTIKGTLHQEEQENKRNYHRVERRYGSFQRTLGLPTTVKPDAIHATLTNGVLRLDIPKAEELKPRRIGINVGSEKQIEIGKK